MGKIFYLMGKSACGKDTIHEILMKDPDLHLRSVVLYTTRPIRNQEINGETYHFVTEEMVQRFDEQGKIIELRCYETVHGPWKYFTADDGQINLENGNYLMIGTLESYICTKKYFGEDALVPLYLNVPDGIRLRRALNREDAQTNPKYAELCRRFLADEKDFSLENLQEAGIKEENTYLNVQFEECLEKLKNTIRTEIDR